MRPGTGRETGLGHAPPTEKIDFFLFLFGFALFKIVLWITLADCIWNLPLNVYDHNIHYMIDWTGITGFDWDEGNARKNDKHGVSMAESEQVFFNMPLLVLEDSIHSLREMRFHALGRTDHGRLLHITFTLRHANEMIRVISARDMHRKERVIYEKTS